MAKPPTAGKCVHCAKPFEVLTWDHVFPQSWYPDNTPNNLPKWEIPSCRECNAEYGELENDLMIRIGLCLDPDDPMSMGIPQKAMRAIDPDSATNPRDKRHREAKRRLILHESWFGNEIPTHGIFPSLGNRFKIPSEDRMAIRISAEKIERLSEKIVRGITYLEDKRFIEPPYSIHSYTLEDEKAQPVRDIITKFGKVYAREPGIIITRAVLPDDGITSLFAIEIWGGRFKQYAHIGKGSSTFA